MEAGITRGIKQEKARARNSNWAEYIEMIEAGEMVTHSISKRRKGAFEGKAKRKRLYGEKLNSRQDKQAKGLFF